MISADFHCHTRYSHDCFASVAAVIDMARHRGLTHLAITDHDAIEGALRARDLAQDLEIIVGCEISLDGGTHLIGLFLQRRPTARTALEAVDEIHAQGGFVLLPHPFQPGAGLLRDGADEQLLSRVDGLEVCNGFEPPERNARAMELARARQLPALVGSDAHYLVDVGRTCVVFPHETGALTPDILRRAPRKLFGPAQDLSALHLADARFRAQTGRSLRPAVPKPLRKLAKHVNWLRFQRQVAAGCQEPLRKELDA
ncbi:MAG TPA: PHP domain-containing protein [Verrucomicrobiae bacterium]|nr:PHP domain-containing protein [Verrucomicrobiae bacterium]